MTAIPSNKRNDWKPRRNVESFADNASWKCLNALTCGSNGQWFWLTKKLRSTSQSPRCPREEGKHHSGLTREHDEAIVQPGLILEAIIVLYDAAITGIMIRCCLIDIRQDDHCVPIKRENHQTLDVLILHHPDQVLQHILYSVVRPMSKICAISSTTWQDPEITRARMRNFREVTNVGSWQRVSKQKQCLQSHVVRSLRRIHTLNPNNRTEGTIPRQNRYKRNAGRNVSSSNAAASFNIG